MLRFAFAGLTTLTTPVAANCPTVVNGTEANFLGGLVNAESFTKCYNANGNPIASLICSPADLQHPCCVQDSNGIVNCFSRDAFNKAIATEAPQAEDLQCAPSVTNGSFYSAIDCFPPADAADCCFGGQSGHFSRCVQFDLPENHYHACTCPSCTGGSVGAAECVDCCSALPRWNCAAAQSSLSTAAIVGIAVGSVAFVGLLSASFLYC